MEYIYKCDTCEKIWTFSDADLKADAQNAKLGAISAIGQMASVLGGGTIMHTKVLQDQTNNLLDKVVDRSRCPYCNSMYISQITREQLKKQKMENNNREKEKIAPKESIQINANASVESLLKRTSIFLEDGDWGKADAYAEACLDMDPTNGEAYLYKMLGALKVTSLDSLKNLNQNLKEAPYYDKVIRFGSADVIGYINEVNSSVEEEERAKAEQVNQKCEAVRLIVKQKREQAKKEKEQKIAELQKEINVVEKDIEAQTIIVEENKGKLFGAAAKARKEAELKVSQQTTLLEKLKKELKSIDNQDYLFKKYNINPEADMTEEEINGLETLNRLEQLGGIEDGQEYPLKAILTDKDFLWSERPYPQYGKISAYFSESKLLLLQYVEDRIWEVVLNKKGAVQTFTNPSKNIFNDVKSIKSDEYKVTYDVDAGVLLIMNDSFDMINPPQDEEVINIIRDVLTLHAGKDIIKYT